MPFEPNNSTPSTAPTRVVISDYEPGSFESARDSNDPVVQVRTGAGYASTNTYDDFAQSNDGDILSTARSGIGSPIIGRDLRPDDLVVVNGMETTVANAERLGFLQRNDAGRYVNGVTPQQRAEEDRRAAAAEREAEHKEAEGRLEGFAVEEEGFLGEVLQATEPGVHIAAMVDVMNHGDLQQSTLERAAGDLGVPPDQARAVFERIRENFSNQAARTVADIGVPDPEAFFAWAEANASGEFREAMQHHVLGRSTAGYKALAQRYLHQLDKVAPDMILGATLGKGISTFRTTDGQVRLRFEDGTVTDWGTALRTGAIRLGRA